MALGNMKDLLQSKHRQIVRDGSKTIFSHLLMEIVYRLTRFTKCRIFFSKTIHLLFIKLFLSLNKNNKHFLISLD